VCFKLSQNLFFVCLPGEVCLISCQSTGFSDSAGAKSLSYTRLLIPADFNLSSSHPLHLSCLFSNLPRQSDIRLVFIYFTFCEFCFLFVSLCLFLILNAISMSVCSCREGEGSDNVFSLSAQPKLINGSLSGSALLCGCLRPNPKADRTELLFLGWTQQGVKEERFTKVFVCE